MRVRWDLSCRLRAERSREGRRVGWPGAAGPLEPVRCRCRCRCPRRPLAAAGLRVPACPAGPGPRCAAAAPGTHLQPPARGSGRGGARRRRRARARGAEQRAGGGGQARPRGGVRRRPGRAGRGAASPGGLRGGSAHCGAIGAGGAGVAEHPRRGARGRGRGGPGPSPGEPRDRRGSRAGHGGLGPARPRHARAGGESSACPRGASAALTGECAPGIEERSHPRVTRGRTEIGWGSLIKYVKKVFVSMMMSCPSLESSCLLYGAHTAGPAERGSAPPPGSGSEQTNQWQVQEQKLNLGTCPRFLGTKRTLKTCILALDIIYCLLCHLLIKKLPGCPNSRGFALMETLGEFLLPE